MKTPFAGCRAYLAKLPPAISGAGGHPATFRAACECVRFGLSDGDALALLREWNGTHCRPPWADKDLIHKLADARRVATGKVRASQPAPAARVVWKIERKNGNCMEPYAENARPATPIQSPSAPTAEFLPRTTPSGDLVIPFACSACFHWWKDGGMTPTETRRHLTGRAALALEHEGQGA